MKNLEIATGAAPTAPVGLAKKRCDFGKPGTSNPILQFKNKPTRGNAIKAKCAECMGCTDTHLELGFRELIRACCSWDCPLHAFRPYRANLAPKPLKRGQLETAGDSA